MPDESTQCENASDIFGPPISTYTRAQAIDDGVLVDVSPVAAEAGFRCPVAVTAAVWHDCVAWTEADEVGRRVLQDEAGRLWDVVWMARLAKVGAGPRLFRLKRVPRKGRGRKHLVTLKIVIGPGDEGEPVVTILQPEED